MALNIVVCIKSVMLDPPVGKTVRSAETCVLNPFDLPALEMALQLRELHGGNVTSLSMGPGETVFALQESMAMGVNRAVLLCDRSMAGADTLATSAVLAAALEKLSPWDLALFGTRSSDSDTGQVGPQTAVQLGFPLVTGADAVKTEGAGLVVSRRMDGFCETYGVSLPAVLTVHPSACQARDLPLGGIQKAFGECAVETWGLSDLGLAPETVGEAGSPTRVLSMKRIQKDRRCEYISGTTEEQVDALVNRLVEQGKIG